MLSLSPLWMIWNNKQSKRQSSINSSTCFLNLAKRALVLVMFIFIVPYLPFECTHGKKAGGHGSTFWICTGGNFPMCHQPGWKFFQKFPYGKFSNWVTPKIILCASRAGYERLWRSRRCMNAKWCCLVFEMRRRRNVCISEVLSPNLTSKYHKQLQLKKSSDLDFPRWVYVPRHTSQWSSSK